ncbi:hypothetical protein BC567DRAFT_214606 [Phyllosticta citribraziliensis]
MGYIKQSCTVARAARVPRSGWQDPWKIALSARHPGHVSSLANRQHPRYGPQYPALQQRRKDSKSAEPVYSCSYPSLSRSAPRSPETPGLRLVQRLHDIDARPNPTRPNVYPIPFQLSPERALTTHSHPFSADRASTRQ